MIAIELWKFLAWLYVVLFRVLGLLVWYIFFLIYTFNAKNFPPRIAFTVYQIFRGMLYFHFYSVWNISSFLWRFTLSHMDYLCVLFNFQIFECSPIISLLIPRFIPLWSEKMLSVISVLLGLSGCVLSWWVSYVYLKRRHILLSVVFCKCQFQPDAWW